MVHPWFLAVLESISPVAKLVSVVFYCFQAALAVGSRGASIWVGTLGCAAVGWLAMHVWLRAWNLKWLGTLPTGLCLACALTTALMAFVIIGAWNLEGFLVGGVEQAGESLKQKAGWYLLAFNKSLSELGFSSTKDSRVKLENAAQLSSVLQITGVEAHRALRAEHPLGFDSADTAPLADVPGEAASNQTFPIQLDPYNRWAEQALDREVRTAVDQVRGIAKQVSNLAVGVVAGLGLLCNVLLGSCGACCAYRAIFRSSYQSTAYLSTL